MRLKFKILAIIATTAISGASLVAKDLPNPGSEQPRIEVAVGDVVPPDQVHVVTHPGRYGLGPELPGSHYAVVGGRLVRVDAESLQVLSVIRMVDGILD